mmetsp:Transcript_5122/g.8017  ORF Transcript_5122/g.8017 Transcript_5122/m.8017 type:complete len:305 (+) Transcript_5122:197-1111(+)
MRYRASLIAQPQSDQNLFDDIQLWCDTVHPYGITGSAIRYVMRKITVTKVEDVEMVLSKIVSNKQNIWAACIVADALFISILYPSLLVPEDVPVPLSPGLINEEVYQVLLLVFYCFVSFTAFLALIHMMVCIVLYAGTSFILDVEDMCWFLMRFHRCLSFINISFLPLVYGLIISVMLSQTIIVGPSRAAPTITLGILTMIFMLVSYIWLRRRFFYLFKNVKGPWSRKLGNYSEKVENYSMQSLKRDNKSEKKSVSSYKPIDEFMDGPVVATAVELVENQRTKAVSHRNSLESSNGQNDIVYSV